MLMGRVSGSRDGKANKCLSQLLNRQGQANAAAASALVKNGTAAVNEQLPAAELAAWTAVSNVLLNLDEFITRE